MRGALTLIDDCVSLRSDEGDALLIFPPGAALTADGLAIDLGNGSLPLDTELADSVGWWIEVSSLAQLEGTLTNVDRCTGSFDRVVVLDNVEGMTPAQ